MTLESEYAHCIPMTIPPSAVSEPLTDFPLIIKIGRSAGKYRDDISDVFVKLGASYQKLAISLEDNTTQLPVEVTEWDVRRQLGILFVKVPTIPTTGMTLKLWYDSTHADNTTNVGAIGSAVGQSVWANGYAGVWHMKNSGGLVLDSTANANHGTIHGATVTDGPLGRCLSFDGADDHVVLGSVPLPANGDHTIQSLSIPASGMTVQSRIYAEGNASKNQGIRQLGLNSDYTPLTGYRNINGTDKNLYGSSPVNPNTPLYLTHTISGIDWALYVNDDAVAIDSWDTTYSDMDYATIGAMKRSTVMYLFKGIIAEVHISSVARSPAWIALTNASLKDELIAFSTPGTESLTGNERMRLKPDGTLIANEFVEV